MIKVLSVFGTRPEAIKMAPVVLELEMRKDHVMSCVCVTAQHRQMLDQVLHLFHIKPDYDLNLMQENQTPTQVASNILHQLEPILQKEKPDWVLVQGDTTTVMATCIVAYYSKVKVGHVEAGLRSFDKWRPFPEEINRRIASVTADLHFAPTIQAKNNLLREGTPGYKIFVTGNPVIDALKSITNQIYDVSPNTFGGVPFQKRIILVTAHRRENFGESFKQICLALKDIAEAYPDEVHIVYPVHLNPNIQAPAKKILSGIPNVSLLEPLDYLSLVYLMKNSEIVLTDSGGIQEEAPTLGKPVLVLRSVTERPEAVEAGTVRLVGTDRKRIVEATVNLLENEDEYRKMALAVNPYGDGKAAPRIVKALLGEEVEEFNYHPKDRQYE